MSQTDTHLCGAQALLTALIHTQCGSLGAESFINKYDSNHFMLTVKVMAFSISEIHTSSSHAQT